MRSLPVKHRLVRRNLLRGAVGLLPLIALPRILKAATPERRIAFLHTHTGETVDVVYSENDDYLPDALAEIDRVCRDFRTGTVHPIDPALLDLLNDVQQAAGKTGRFEIISAFRSPATNHMLAKAGSGVADRSLHLTGQAIDVRLPGVRTLDVQRIALERAGGGVGYYPDSDFVHLDTGRVRRW